MQPRRGGGGAGEAGQLLPETTLLLGLGAGVTLQWRLGARAGSGGDKMEQSYDKEWGSNRGMYKSGCEMT